MLMVNDALGSGPAVLMLHAGVCDRRMWWPQVQELIGTHRVIAPDLPGFGETPLRPGGFSFVAEVVELLDSLGVEKTFVVGSSFGARIAMDVAAAVPDRVLGLLLLCPAYGALPPTPAAERFDSEETRLLEAGDVDAAVDLNVDTWVGPDAEPATVTLVGEMQRRAFEVQLAADEWADPPQSTDGDADLSAISAPTLVVSGDLDMDHFRAIAEHVVDEVEHARLVTLPWAGHLPSLERPGEVTSLIERFVDELSFLA